MKYLIFLFSFLFSVTTFAQSKKLPVLNSNSPTVSYSDNGWFEKDGWTLVPEAKPDVYLSDRSSKTKKVIFYSDIDSIEFKVKPGATFDFVILLNGKDSCFTRIQSVVPPGKPKIASTKIDTIPFTLTEHDAIHVKAILNEKDTMNLHFDTGSFGFRLTQKAIKEKTDMLSQQPDYMMGKGKPDFNSLGQAKSLRLGTMNFESPRIRATLLTAYDMDGKFGWVLFDGKYLEINYSENLLIIHSQKPAGLRKYTKLPIEWVRPFICIKASLKVDSKKYKGTFLLDSGANQALIIDRDWAKAQNFPDDLEVLRTTTLRDPRGNEFEAKTVKCPSLVVKKNELVDVPATMLSGQNPTGFPINYFGNEVMKRYDTILDFQNDVIYFRSNKLSSTPFKDVLKYSVG
ncbi:MAG: hypothetical protein ACI85O_000143 [Saprospiraceae bacterium]|jgi:hypothetical protein